MSLPITENLLAERSPLAPRRPVGELDSCDRRQSGPQESDPRKTPERLLRDAVRMLAMDGGRLQWVDHEARRLRPYVQWGNGLPSSVSTPSPFAGLGSPVARAGLGGSLVDSSLVDSSLFEPQPRRPDVPTPVRYCAVPLRVGGRTEAVLELASCRSELRTEEWFQTLELLALRLTLAHTEARLHQEVKRARQAEVGASEQELAALVKALEARHLETEGHSQRVTAQTVQLARAAGTAGDALEERSGRERCCTMSGSWGSRTPSY